MWLRPDSIQAMSAFRGTPVDVAGGTPTLIVRPNPNRIAIGFALGTTAAFSFAVGPDERPDLRGFAQPSQSANLWFYVFQHGPMVCANWYAFSSGMVTVTAWEWYKLPGK